MPDAEFLTPKQLADKMNIPVRRVRRAIREGRLPVIELGPRTRRIPKDALREFALRLRR